MQKESFQVIGDRPDETVERLKYFSCRFGEIVMGGMKRENVIAFSPDALTSRFFQFTSPASDNADGLSAGPIPPKSLWLRRPGAHARA